MTTNGKPATATPHRAQRHWWDTLSDLESRLIAAAVTVPVLCVIFMLTFERDLALTACALMYASALWLGAGALIARIARARRRARS
jgi:hypothetical protein